MSEGKRQWIENFDDYLDDLQAVIDWSQRELPQVPLYLHGHSLGGAICLRYAARRSIPYNGLMINAPAFRVGTGVSAFRQLLAKCLNSVLPRLSLSANLDMSALSRDLDEIEKSKNDPLSCQFNTIRQGYEILKALPELRQDVERITQPILFTHGQNDRLVDWQGTEELHRHCGSVDREVCYFEQGYHELHNDYDRELYWKTLLDWLRRR